jgi:twinkle protein
MIIKYADIRDSVMRLRKEGLPPGHSTGWDEVDNHFRPEPGYFCVITGIPGHGKSEFMDALIVNTMWMYGWQWAIFSPENYPTALHFNKLAEKFIGAPQAEAPDKDYKMAAEMIDEYATFIYPPEGAEVTLEELLETVKTIKDTYGAKAFILDPWNEIDHSRPSGMTETEYIDRSLRHFRRFCREEKMFGVIVAHPTKMSPLKDGSMPPVNLWSISGSAAWRNKADYGLVVRRDDMTKNEPTLSVQKIKQKNFGKVGEVQMYYDYRSGRMKDRLQDKFKLPRRKC